MSTRWGKKCLPVCPESDFSAISIVLINAVIGMVFSAHLPQHAVRVSLKWSFDRFARLYWFGSLRLFQMILRTVIFAHSFLHDLTQKNLIEQRYAFLLIIGLLLILSDGKG